DQRRFVVFPEMISISSRSLGAHLAQYTPRSHPTSSNRSIAFSNDCEVRNFTLKMLRIREGFIATIASKET
ncbi:hypothetical protein PMAYCL1PPCAC_14259, partial [Pristionchus mayeri]